MEGQEYLNQISSAVRPVKKPRGKASILSSKIFLVSAIGVVALIFIIILGAILGGSKGDDKSLGYALRLHLDNTSSIIQDYQSSVKSSDLRSSSASLYSILSSTSSNLTNYLDETYGLKDKEIPSGIVSEADLSRDDLESALFNAKINGILDRIYAHQMAHEITLILSEESKLISSTKNSTLEDLLTTSYNSLENLYTKFNDFSETN